MYFSSARMDFSGRPLKPLVVFFPSHDTRIIMSTLFTVVNIAHYLERPLLPYTNKGLGQAVAINGMVLTFKRETGRTGIQRALWIEDDIILDMGQAGDLARMIKHADENSYNIVAPYSTGINGDTGEKNFVYYKFPEGNEIGRPFTLEETRALKPYDLIHGVAGLGFYYGDVNLDYVFHEGDYNGKDRFGLPSYAGIDWNYFLDNKIELRHYPVRITHEKSQEFGNSEVLS
jgi:hypothetical protein